MKTSIKIEVPLSDDRSTNEEFIIDPPCFYCGAEVDKTGDFNWKHGVAFPIKYWKFKELKDVQDNKGATKFSSCHLKLPFCPSHLKPEKSFEIINTIWLIASFVAGIISFIVLLIERSDQGWLYIAGPLAVIFFALILFGAIRQWIKKLIIKSKPTLQDYSKNEGHYGIEVGGVRTDGGEVGIGPICYFLILSFTSPKIAQRFLTAYPQAIVTEGKELLS